MENVGVTLNSSSSHEHVEDEWSILESWDAGDSEEGAESGAAVAQLERSLEQRAQLLKKKKEKQAAREQQLQEEQKAMVENQDSANDDLLNADADFTNSQLLVSGGMGLSQPPPVMKILRRPISEGNLQNQEGKAESLESSESISNAVQGLQVQNGGVLRKSSTGTSLKPLEEREKAYAIARQRIFGDKNSYPSDDEDSVEVEVAEKIEEKPTPGILKISKKETEESEAAQIAVIPQVLEEKPLPTPPAGQKKSKKKNRNKNSGGGKGVQQQPSTIPTQSVRPSPPQSVPQVVLRPPVARSGGVSQGVRPLVPMPDLSKPPPTLSPGRMPPGPPPTAYRGQVGAGHPHYGTGYSSGTSSYTQEVPYGHPPRAYYPQQQPASSVQVVRQQQVPPCSVRPVQDQQQDYGRVQQIGAAGLQQGRVNFPQQHQYSLGQNSRFVTAPNVGYCTTSVRIPCPPANQQQRNQNTGGGY